MESARCDGRERHLQTVAAWEDRRAERNLGKHVRVCGVSLGGNMDLRISLLIGVAAIGFLNSGANAQSGPDLLAQAAPSTAGTVPATGSAVATPPATTMPYQNSTTTSYSSWPPATPSSPGYRSTQPTYQTNPAAGAANAVAGTTQGATPVCGPASPATAAPATVPATTTASACPP